MVADLWNFYQKLLSDYICNNYYNYEVHYTYNYVSSLSFYTFKILLPVELLVLYPVLSKCPHYIL